MRLEFILFELGSLPACLIKGSSTDCSVILELICYQGTSQFGTLHISILKYLIFIVNLCINFCLGQYSASLHVTLFWCKQEKPGMPERGYREKSPQRGQSALLIENNYFTPQGILFNLTLITVN